MADNREGGLAPESHPPTGNLARDIIDAPTRGHLHESMAWIFAGFDLAVWIVEAVFKGFKSEVGGHVGLILFIAGIVCAAAVVYFGVLAKIEQAENRARQATAIAKAVYDAKSECRAEYASDWTEPNPFGRLLNPFAAVCILSKDSVRISTLVANAYHLARDLRLVDGWVIFKDITGDNDGVEIAKVQVTPWAETIPAQTANGLRVSEPAMLAPEVMTGIREVYARGTLRVLFRSKYATVAAPGKPDHCRATTERVRLDIES